LFSGFFCLCPQEQHHSCLAKVTVLSFFKNAWIKNDEYINNNLNFTSFLVVKENLIKFHFFFSC